MELNVVISNLKNKQYKLEIIRNNVQLDYKAKIEDIDSEIKRINDAVKCIEDLTQELICPRCKGTGEERYCDGAGDMDDRECPLCHGTGINEKLKEENNVRL